MAFRDVFVGHSWLCLFSMMCFAHAITVSNSTQAVPTYTWHYNASSSIDPSVNIKSNGTGTAYAYACQSASQSWSWASSSQLEEASSTWPVVPLYTTTSTLTKQFWEIWTTDCDGVTHARGTTPTSTSVYTNSTVYTSWTITPSYTLPPEPSCIIQPSDCKAVLESYSAETSALDKYESLLTVPFYVTSRPIMPSCTSICTAPVDCAIMGDHVQLIYWPVTTTGANSCGTNGTTITNSDTGPSRTIVTLGTTFTSPTQYLSFRSLSAWDWGCNTEIGTGVAGTIIPIKPGHLSSARGWHLGRSPYSFNLADLNGFVTSAAYFQMQAYDWSGPDRQTIFDDLYYPTIWLPDIVTELKPEWSSCGLSPFGVNDPPIQLTSVARVDPATTKAPIETPGYDLPHGSAKPGATPTSTAKPSVLPDGIYNPKPSSKKPEQAAVAQSSSTKGNLGDWIASALGLPKVTSSKASAVPTKTIVIGKNGASVHGQSGTIPFADMLTTEVTATATLAYAAAYTMQSGHTVVVVNDETMTVGAPETEVDGHAVSLAEGGLVMDGLTIPYATATEESSADSSTVDLEETTTSESSTAASSPSETTPTSDSTEAVSTSSLANQGFQISGSLALLISFLTMIMLT